MICAPTQISTPHLSDDGGFVLRGREFIFSTGGISNMKKRIMIFVSLLCAILSIGAMAFPGAYVMRWASPNPNDIWTSSYSYFSMTPYGYANFFPLITAILVIVCAVFLLLQIFLGKFIKTAFTLTTIGLFTSVFALLMSYEKTAPGIIITALLIISVGSQLVCIRNK